MSFAKHKVCLIDDDNIYQFTARRILESTGLAGEIRPVQREAGASDAERSADARRLRAPLAGAYADADAAGTR